MKRVLAINYSQTGQLDSIVENFLKGFGKDVDVDRQKIRLKNEYPFPWTSEVFFDQMPETVLRESVEIKEIPFKYDSYDLIILGYQPWYLSLALPVNGLFQDEEFQKRLSNTPVISVIGARNMWLNSQQQLVDKIKEYNGDLVANIPLIDRVQNHVSAFTKLHWMLKGKKTRKWGVFPKPGISDEDIIGAEVFGQIVNRYLNRGEYSGLQSEILATKKIGIKSSILLIESRAPKLFNVWANLIKNKGTTPRKRKRLVGFFKWYLIVALFVVSPPVVFLHKLFMPFYFWRVKNNKTKYLYLGIKH